MTFNGGDISISYEHHCSIINKKRELIDLVHVLFLTNWYQFSEKNCSEIKKAHPILILHLCFEHYSEVERQFFLFLLQVLR